MSKRTTEEILDSVNVGGKMEFQAVNIYDESTIFDTHGKPVESYSTIFRVVVYSMGGSGHLDNWHVDAVAMLAAAKGVYK
jgi:hypothetical protein